MQKAAVPKVSVCIPTYNYGHYLGDALESVLDQTFGDFELLVIDDCSTDDTEAVVGRFQLRDARIRYRRNPARLGFAGNFSRCVALASGEYVKILCADDLLAPDCLQKMVREMEDHPGVSLVSCVRQLVDSGLVPVGSASYAPRYTLCSGSDAARRCLLGVDNRIGEPSAVLFRRHDAARGFHSGYSLLVDLEMWLHLLEKGEFAFIPERLCKIRRHAGQATNDCIQTMLFLDDLDRLYEDYFDKPHLHTSLLDEARWRFCATFNIWEKRYVPQSHPMIREKISRLMNYRLAAVIMPLYFSLLKLVSFRKSTR